MWIKTPTELEGTDDSTEICASTTTFTFYPSLSCGPLLYTHSASHVNLKFIELNYELGY